MAIELDSPFAREAKYNADYAKEFKRFLGDENCRAVPTVNGFEENETNANRVEFRSRGFSVAHDNEVNRNYHKAVRELRHIREQMEFKDGRQIIVEKIIFVREPFPGGFDYMGHLVAVGYWREQDFGRHLLLGDTP